MIQIFIAQTQLPPESLGGGMGMLCAIIAFSTLLTMIGYVIYRLISK